MHDLGAGYLSTALLIQALENEETSFRNQSIVGLIPCLLKKLMGSLLMCISLISNCWALGKCERQ